MSTSRFCSALPVDSLVVSFSAAEYGLFELRSRHPTPDRNTGYGMMVKFSPYIMGPKFTQADCVAFPKLGFAGMVTQIVLRKNLVEAVPGAAEYLKYMLERPAVQKIVTDQEEAIEKLMTSRKK